MSDEFDSLFDGPPAAAAPVAPVVAGGAAASVAPAVDTVAVLPVKTEAPALWLPIYKHGADVQFEGAHHKVNYVHISKKGLFVRLQEKEGVVPAEKLNIALTRVVLPLHTYQSPLGLQPPLPSGTERTK